MVVEIRISGLTPAAASFASDLTEVSQSAGGGSYLTKKVTETQRTTLMGTIMQLSSIAQITSGSAGGIFYSNGTTGALLNGTATAGQILQSGLSAAPSWSTAVYPASTTLNQLLYSSSSNVIAGLATANNGILVTGTSGIPSLLANGTTGQVLIATTGSPPSWTSVSSVGVSSLTGTLNQINFSSSIGSITASLSNGISLGTYQGTSPPAGGILCSGEVGIGASTVQGAFTINLASNYYSIFVGSTITNSVSFPNGVGIYNTPTLVATLTNTASLGFVNSPTFSASGAGTYNTAYGATFSLLQQGNPTVANAYTVTIATPAVGTNRYALYVEGKTGINVPLPVNLLDINGGVAIGSYAGVNTAPSNGIIVSGSSSIGVSAPASNYRFHVENTVSTVIRAINTGIAGSGSGAVILVAANPGAAMATGNRLGALQFNGVNDNAGTYQTTTPAIIAAFAAETWTTAAAGSYLSFFTTASTTLTRSEVMRVNQNGGVAIGSSFVTTLPPASGLIVNGNFGVNTTTPQNKFDVNGGMAIGSYAGVNATSSGNLIMSGWFGLGTSSPAQPFSLQISNNASSDYLAQIQGAQVGLNTSANKAAILINTNINPNFAGSIGCQELWINSVFNPQSGNTINRASGIYLTSTASGGAGSVTDGYHIHATQCSHGGTTNVAIYAYDMSIGYTSVTPGNGNLLISGSMSLGANSLTTSAILSLTSTTQGFLPPRMTTTQKNAVSSPAESLIVYDNTLHAPYFYNGSAWTAFGAGGGVTSIAGTNNQITASASTGAITLSLPNTIGIGTTSPAGQLEVIHGNNQASYLSGYTASSGIGPTFCIREARGSLGSFTAAIIGDLLGQIAFGGATDASTFANSSAQILVSAAENWNGSAQGSNMSLNITKIATTTSLSGLTLDGYGNTYVGSTVGNSTTATAGWCYITSCAGPPTGVPSQTPSGFVPHQYDRTNNKLYIYNGGWKSILLV